MRDCDGTHEARALDRERGSRVPDCIGLSLIGFLIAAVAARVILAHSL
ncbi:hypothetical protein MKL09_17855 [Methylobacterium sp. J-048]|nr:hypothetical protein [Methylobacterium sp. J-048]MCJ2058408.1 hypothetical protein [Methylobacterium sp. J-048]